MENNHFDVIVIGGAIMGSSVAYFLKQLDSAIDVAVIEPDPTYEFASTSRASGGARTLFSCPENIEMSNFSLDFIRHFPTLMAIDGKPAPIDWKEQGYLFIVDDAHMNVLEENARIQQSLGAEIRLLDRTGLRAHFPSMFVDDLGGGAYSPHDGWCDPNSFLHGFRKKAKALGAHFIQDKVVGFQKTDASITHAHLESKRVISADAFVNATGAWAGLVGDMAGMALPIRPLRRFEHYFSGHKPIEPLPYVKDLNRLAFRPEGTGYSGGLVDSNEPRGFNFEVDHDYFERVVWPALAHRFLDGFEGARCHRTWSGLYEQCELDGNPIIGNWNGGLENFYVISGFSGHGMMHAPAAGRAIAELITRERFETIDLTRLGYARVEANLPYAERGIL